MMLGACVKSSTPRTLDPLDIYELPRANSSRPIYIDNDSYYSQPAQSPAYNYDGCAQIGDGPSCGGG
jgi:hypothetical protein